MSCGAPNLTATRGRHCARGNEHTFGTPRLNTQSRATHNQEDSGLLERRVRLHDAASRSAGAVGLLARQIFSALELRCLHTLKAQLIRDKTGCPWQQ